MTPSVSVRHNRLHLGKMSRHTNVKAKKDTQTAKKAPEMSNMAKKITPWFWALLVFISILTALKSDSYLPMQKFIKMFWRISGVVMVPVIEERWWMACRRSWAARSVGMPSRREDDRARRLSAARPRASA